MGCLAGGTYRVCAFSMLKSINRKKKDHKDPVKFKWMIVLLQQAKNN